MRDDVGVMVGRRLKARRRLLGISQQTLADSCGVTFQQIHKYEAAVCRLSATMLWKLACALDVEINYFFAGLDQESAPQDERRVVAMERRAI